MFVREFDWRRFLHGVWGTEPMREYCARHGLVCPAVGYRPPSPADEFMGWSAFRSLDRDIQAAIEYDARRVNELSSPDANALLLEAGGDAGRPPAEVPAGEAVALWYFVHRPNLFREVFHRHRPITRGTWRVGRTAPGLPLDRLDDRAAALADALPAACADHSGQPYAVVDGYTTPDGFVFEAHISERVRRITAFSTAGRSVIAVRPATTVVFAYEAGTGFVRLYSIARSQTRAHDLFQAFARAVLGQPVHPITRAYDLDCLKRPPALPPDAFDMESVRVKSMTFTYPAHHARRRLTFDTSVGDDPHAVYDLIHTHIDHPLLDEMAVTHAELLVWLRSGGDRRCISVRLWADACSLGYDWLGMRLLGCLSRWGLANA